MSYFSQSSAAAGRYPTFGRFGDENDVVQASHRAYVHLTTLTAHVRLCPVDTGLDHTPAEGFIGPNGTMMSGRSAVAREQCRRFRAEV